MHTYRRKDLITDLLGKWNSPEKGEAVDAASLQTYSLQQRKAAVLDVSMRVRQNYDTAKSVLDQVGRMQSMLQDLNMQLEEKLQSAAGISGRDSYTVDTLRFTFAHYTPLLVCIRYLNRPLCI